MPASGRQHYGQGGTTDGKKNYEEEIKIPIIQL
jgi:hypothetical protein